ncbi:flagellar protein FlaG [Neptuniibacter pectenicola]|jgi:flagellar protein FlaG|uniref:flagellar protein FlaG n=1 Tax=Neptuniibacter pectenicola TaxID=1806669 RepID=UPI00082CFF74|nr:flagellar protein FlaG [Neptuniibacter pectenicola]
MAIESIGAAAANVIQPTQQTQQTGSQVAKPQPVEAPQKNEQFQQTQEVSAEKLDAAINRLNEMMESSQRSLSFSVDKASDQVVVEVRDLTTDKVIRQIPNEEALAFAESLDRMIGFLFDKKA